MSAKAGIGIVGLGYWYGAFHLARALREHRRAELLAVACSDRERLQAFTGLFPCRGYSDYRELLERRDITAVMISPPTADIPGMACDAAKAGKHMLVAARIGMTLEEADDIVAAVRQSGVKTVTLEGEVKFDDPRPLETVRSGEIGDIVHVDCASHSSLAEDWYSSGRCGWFADPSKVPGGAFLDYSVYSLQALREFCGSRVARVDYARTANLIHKDLEVEDWGMACFTLANGVTARVEASWTIVTPRLTSPSPKANSYCRFEVVGTRGRLVTEVNPVPHFYLLSQNQPYWSVSRCGAGPMTEASPPGYPMLDHLLDCITEDRPTMADVTLARDSLEVVLAAYRSARENRPIELSPRGQGGSPIPTTPSGR